MDLWRGLVVGSHEEVIQHMQQLLRSLAFVCLSSIVLTICQSTQAQTPSSASQAKRGQVAKTSKTAVEGEPEGKIVRLSCKFDRFMEISSPPNGQEVKNGSSCPGARCPAMALYTIDEKNGWVLSDASFNKVLDERAEAGGHQGHHVEGTSINRTTGDLYYSHILMRDETVYLSIEVWGKCDKASAMQKKF